MCINKYSFLAYRWLAFWVAQQDEPLYGRVKLQSASEILKLVWPKEQ